MPPRRSKSNNPQAHAQQTPTVSSSTTQNATAPSRKRKRTTRNADTEVAPASTVSAGDTASSSAPRKRQRKAKDAPAPASAAVASAPTSAAATDASALAQWEEHKRRHGTKFKPRTASAAATSEVSFRTMPPPMAPPSDIARAQAHPGLVRSYTEPAGGESRNFGFTPEQNAVPFPPPLSRSASYPISSFGAPALYPPPPVAKPATARSYGTKFIVHTPGPTGLVQAATTYLPLQHPPPLPPASTGPSAATSLQYGLVYPQLQAPPPPTLPHHAITQSQTLVPMVQPHLPFPEFDPLLEMAPVPVSPEPSPSSYVPERVPTPVLYEPAPATQTVVDDVVPAQQPSPTQTTSNSSGFWWQMIKRTPLTREPPVSIPPPAPARRFESMSSLTQPAVEPRVDKLAIPTPTTVSPSDLFPSPPIKQQGKSLAEFWEELEQERMNRVNVAE